MVTSMGDGVGDRGGNTNSYEVATTGFTPAVDVHLRAISFTSFVYTSAGVIEFNGVVVAGPFAGSDAFRLEVDVPLIAGQKYVVTYRQIGGGRVRIGRSLGVVTYPIFGTMDVAPEFTTVASPSYLFEFDDIPVFSKSDFNLEDDEPGRLAVGFAMEPDKGRWVVNGMGLGGTGGGSSLVAADRVYYGDLLIADNT